MKSKESTLRTLDVVETMAVAGGAELTAQERDTLIERNTQRAIQTCGKGNVAEVSTDGFRCK